MYYTSGKDVTVTIWEKGITFHAKIEKWNHNEVIVNEKNNRAKWTFPYQDVLKGKIKISPKRTH
ncbi:hypothetical protein [Ammoniphilus sp. CFH 90114]|uniref:hypothetical protein n=1 Tax=Ammoniphilus sp. CFH 90114 TaxID=2493665 RepID=UPI00100DD15F|nr:hypothetical protein [Ammoniphilus sp. CFH 90114]RXT06318.1 hypothetical protein EIZ39_14635 [Ammoniphilus sp. CFH 90114]